MRRSATVLAAVAAALALALSACGSSSDTGRTSTQAGESTSTSAPSTTTATTSTTAPLSTATTTTTTASTTTVAGAPPCTASDLALSYLGQQGATGHGILGFALRNTGSGACHTFGYPGVLFLDKSGRPLPTDTVRATHDFFGPAPESRLLIEPGANFSFRLGVTHGVVPGSKCATAYGLQVIPPDDTVTLRVAIPGGAYECRATTVSPVRPGNSAYQ